MSLSTTLAAGFFLLTGAASAQVICTRNGDQVYCNGSLQQPKPAAPRVHFDPYGSRLSGYEAGVRDARDANVADATQLYLNGKVPPEDRERFLQFIAKQGGDVTWFRNDMAIKDQQEAALRAPLPSEPSPTQALSSRAEDLRIQLLEVQLAKAKLDLENSQASHNKRTRVVAKNGVGRFTGRKEALKSGSVTGVGRWKCEYAVGSDLVWRSVSGSCPNAIDVP